MTELRNKDEFLNALTNSGIQVMMFTAFWCPDCMYIKPFLPEIEEQFSDLQFYSLNRDHCMDIAIEYEVMGILALYVSRMEKKYQDLFLHFARQKKK